MAEHDINLVTAKASSIVQENLKSSLATPAAAITPATVTAMAGMMKGGALQVHESVGTALTGMASKAAEFANTNPTLAASLTSARTALSTLSGKLMPSGNPAAFGQTLMQAQGHINDAIELKTATNFMANASFGNFGSGVTNMSSMATQGLNGALGDLTKAAKAFEAAGPIFDMKNIASMGSSAGLVDKLSSVKLGNSTGVTEALSKAGVDASRLNDPVYAKTLDKVMSSIKDPKVISTVTDQLGIKPGGNISSLKDLTDLSKVAPSGSGLIASASGAIGGAGTGLPDLKGMASKFSDMGAKFKNPAAAATMLKSIEIPSIPTLDAAAPSLNSLMGDLKGDLDDMTGTGNGPMGLPNIKDMMGAATGGPQIDALNAAIASGNPTAITSAVAGVNSMITSSQSLLEKAGVDIDTPVPKSLGSIMSFGQNLHKMGADVSGSGITDVLKGMATNDKYGEAIKASLAEGKNKALMMANGIKPPDFSGGNPLAKLPTAGADNTLTGGSTLLGG